MPGLSDYVIMVRGRAKAFLAGPPLLKAATGARSPPTRSWEAPRCTPASPGLGEYLAEKNDNADGLRIARDVVSRLRSNAEAPASPIVDDRVDRAAALAG
jgi:geranyl-CoA carboxylase beta subunit